MSSSRNFTFHKSTTEDEIKRPKDHLQRETAGNQNSARKVQKSYGAFRAQKDNDDEMMDRLFRKGGPGESDVSPAKSAVSSGHRVVGQKREEEVLEQIEKKIQELLEQVDRAKEERQNSPRKLAGQKEYQELSALSIQFKEVQRQVSRFSQEAEVMDSSTETKLLQFKHIIAMGLSDIKELNSALRNSIVSPTKIDLQKNISQGLEQLKQEQGTLRFAQGLREVHERVVLHREAFEQTEVIVAGMKEAPQLEKESELAVNNLLEDIQRNLQDLNQLVGELEQLKELKTDDFERLKVIQEKENKLKSSYELTSELQQLQVQVSMEFQKKCKLLRQQLKNKSETLGWTLENLEQSNKKVFQSAQTTLKIVTEFAGYKVQAELISKMTETTVKQHAELAKQLDVEVTKKEDSLLQLFQVFRTLISLEWRMSVLETKAIDFQLKAQLWEKGLKNDLQNQKEKFLKEQERIRAELEEKVGKEEEKMGGLDLDIQQLYEEAEALHDPHLLSEVQKEVQSLKAGLKASERSKRQLQNALQQLSGELGQKMEKPEMDAIERELKHNAEQVEELAQQNDGLVEQMERARTKLREAAQAEKAIAKNECFTLVSQVREELEGLLELVAKSEVQLIMLQRSKQEAEQQMSEEPYQLAKDLEKLRQIKSIQAKLETEQRELQEFKRQYESLQQETKQCESVLEEAGAAGAFKDIEHSLSARIQKENSALKSQVKAQLEDRYPPIWEQIQQFMKQSEIKTQVFNACVRLQTKRAKQCEDLEGETTQFKERILDLASKLAARDDVKGGKRVRLDALQEDLRGLEDEVRKKLKEIRRQEQLLEQICQDLTLTTVKVVSAKDLENAKLELENMRTLDGLEGDLQGLYQRIEEKANQIDNFFQDLLNGQVGDCEERLRDAKERLRKLVRRDTDWNISSNDFDQDMLQDLAVSDDSASLKDLNSKIQSEEAKDRRKLRDIDQKAHSLQDLLASIESQMQGKGQLAPQKLQEILDQIEDCIGSTDVLNNEVAHLEGNLAEQKQEWEEAVVKDKELNDIVSRALKQLQAQKALVEGVGKRGNEIAELLEGFLVVLQAMDKNPDYEARKPMIEKLKDQVASAKAEVVEIEMDSDTAFAKIRELVKQGENCDSLESAGVLAKKVRDHQEKVETLDLKSDALLDQLQKRRVKLADADVNENAKKRKAELGEIEELCNEVARKIQELQPYILQVYKQNQEQGELYKGQLREMQDKFEQTKDQTYDLAPKIDRLLAKINDRDLPSAQLQQIPPFIKEVLALRASVDLPKDLLLDLKKQADILLNRLGNVDFDQKFEELAASYDDQSARLQKLRQELEQLKDLDAAFIGYTSDEEEEQFVDKLDGDLEDLFNDCGESEQKNAEIKESLEKFQIILDQKDKGVSLSPQEIEERAQGAGQIQNDQEQLLDFIEDMEDRDQAAIEVFMGMDVDAKLGRRRQEVEELDKRIVQFQENQDELEKELKVAHQRLSSQSEQDDKLQAVTQAVDDMKKMQKEYPKIRSDLQSVAEDIEDLSNSDESQFALLLGNIQLKKRILECLNRIRDLRAKYQDLRKIYELNKPLAQKRYKAAKGDDVDQMLSNWLNGNDCPVPIQRLGKGYYMFGTKKIFAKIINGQLLIRVGGGFMSIDEFMFYYGAQELNRMLAYQGQEQENLEVDLGNVVDDDVNKSDLMKVDDNGRPLIGIQQMKKRMSPRPASSQVANVKATPKATSGKKQPQPGAAGSFVKQGASRIGSGIPKK